MTIERTTNSVLASENGNKHITLAYSREDASQLCPIGFSGAEEAFSNINNKEDENENTTE